MNNKFFLFEAGKRFEDFEATCMSSGYMSVLLWKNGKNKYFII